MKKVFRLLSVCSAIVSSIAMAQVVPPPEAGVDMNRFPKPLQSTIFAEQKLLGVRDISRDNLEEFFIPENGNVFRLPGYWVDLDKWDVQINWAQAPKGFDKVYFREKNGKKQMYLPLHPTSIDYHTDYIQGAEREDLFIVTASGSVRSMFSTLDPEKSPSPDVKDMPVFVTKATLNRHVGGGPRLNHRHEMAKGFYVSEILEASKDIMPKSFGFYPEFMIATPKGAEFGGFILRSIPKEVLSGEVKQVPFYALYADQPDGSLPYVLRMAKNANVPVDVFFRQNILRPVLEQWVELVLDHGLVPQPHGQNLVFEFDKKGRDMGRIIHRDFGYFSFDVEYRNHLGLPMPPKFMFGDYEVDFPHREILYGTSLSLYLTNITGNMGEAHERWFKAGLVSNPKYEKEYYKMMVSDLERAWKKKTGQTISLGGNVENIREKIIEYRTKVLATPKVMSCARVHL